MTSREASEGKLVGQTDADVGGGGPDRSPGFDDPDEPHGCEYDDEDRNCHSCGGDGFVEEDDWQEERYGQLVTCWNCRGSGLSRDCWLW